MSDRPHCSAINAIARRTFRQSIESPIAYVVGIFFFGFVGSILGANYFVANQAELQALDGIAPWALWFVVPALTMGLFSEEFRLGTFEHLATLPLTDWEIVLGKYLGFVRLAAIGMGALAVFGIIIFMTVQPQIGVDWGAMFGVLAGLFFLCLTYGSMGLFASSLARNQVVSLILGMVFCTFVFFMSQFSDMFPGPLARLADSIGVLSHVDTLGRGVWDLRDLLYFASVIFFFLYLTVQRLSTRRF
jgi:ABC-2 type transport system permease protein